MAFILFLISGIILIIYGILVGSAQSGSNFFLVWLLIGGLLILFGFALHFHWLDPVPIWIRRICRLLLVCILILIGIGIACSLSGFGKVSKTSADTIIVLGAQIRGDQPSRVLLYRLNTAEAYLKKHPDTNCIVSGGQGANETRAEAAVMKDWLVDHGIDSNRIQVEDKSRNTNQNLLFSQKLLETETDRISIVTNNFHVFRSVKLAEKQGYRHISGIPAPTAPFYLPNNMLRESLAIIKDKLMGHIE